MYILCQFDDLQKTNIIIEWFMKILIVHLHLQMPFHAFLPFQTLLANFAEFQVYTKENIEKTPIRSNLCG